MRDHDGVHEFFGPCVFDFQCLLILEGLAGKGAYNIDGNCGLKAVMKSWSDGVGT